MPGRTIAATAVFSSNFNAETIAAALKGRKSGDGWVARCPAHEDHDPSLSIQEKDGKTLLHCFAGCAQDAVLNALRQRGLWPTEPQSKRLPTAAVCQLPPNCPPKRSAQALWDGYSPASPSHPYLTRKRIRVHGARAVPGQSQSTLAIPLTDVMGVIHGLQYIAADGTKKFLAGSRVKGHFFLVGKANIGDPLCIAEGFATAASIHEAMGVQVAVAFNAGNLESVTQALHQHWPGRPIVLCADADAPGLAKARAAAQAVGGTVAIPNFGTQRPNGTTDFNDLFTNYGSEAVLNSIRTAQTAFPALENLVEQSITDPGYVFRPDVVEQLRRFRTADHAQFETLRARLKQKTKCRVTHLDQAIDQKSKPDRDNGNAGLADQLVALASEALNNWDDVFVSVWDSNFKEAFADLTDEGRRETWPVGGGSFREWLTVQFFEKTGKTPSSDALKSAINLIRSEASRGGQQRAVFIRCGAYNEKLYLDLCDAAWRIVEISTSGWRVADSTALGPVRFCRYPEMKPLPEPQPNGAIDALREFVNIKSDPDFILLVAWLLAALRNTGPYPVLVLSGEQGSAKSTAVRILRALIDPSQVPMRLFPHQATDLFIAARHNHILAFDNLSYLSPAVSDTLCQLATGGGLGTRRLYTDEDELLINASCPIILNGIENVAVRGDLADRSIFLTLEPIPKQDRRLESELWARFEQERPRILGALLDAMVVGLNRLSDIRLPEIPRMADFAQWSVACETAWWPTGTFLAVYAKNQQEAVEEMVASDAVANSIHLLAQASLQWDGTPSELLLVLNEIVGEQTAKSKRWPGNASTLSKYLRRVMPLLRQIGIEVSFRRIGHSRVRSIQIRSV